MGLDCRCGVVSFLLFEENLLLLSLPLDPLFRDPGHELHPALVLPVRPLNSNRGGQQRRLVGPLGVLQPNPKCPPPRLLYPPPRPPLDNLNPLLKVDPFHLLLPQHLLRHDPGALRGVNRGALGGGGAGELGLGGEELGAEVGDVRGYF